ncbi:flagellar basal body rod protein FlgC [Acidisoma sp. 7E03]
MADIYSIVGSSLAAQNARIGVIASNLANVDSVAMPGQQPYRAHELVFQAAPVGTQATQEVAFEPGAGAGSDASGLGVRIAGTVLSNAPPVRNYEPGSPYADASGYVTGSNVSQVGQMVDLINSSNSYAASVAVLQQASRVDQQMLNSFQVS